MVAIALSVLMLVAGTWMACQTEQVTERAGACHRIQARLAGLLIIGGLLLIGFGVASAMHSGANPCALLAIPE